MGATTADAQRVLASAGADIKVDGIWGPRSTRAYKAASPGVQAQVKDLFISRGKRLPWEQITISVSDAQAMVARAAGEVGMISHVKALQQFLEYEAPRVGAARDQYLVTAQNGSSRGLMQMQPAAWSDARKEWPSLPDYSKVFDAYSNILAGVVYAKINARAIVKNGYPVTGKNLYLAHNQGAGFFRGARTAVEKQSKLVQQLIASGPDR